MAWLCKLINPDEVPDKERQPGDMWFEPWYLQSDHERYYLSDYYLNNVKGKRPPIVVRLPSGRDFCVDGRTRGDSSGWVVTGDAPNITVHPSINHVGKYHGWLQSGMLSEDVEGRTF
jgi:hypothetical protein